MQTISIVFDGVKDRAYPSGGITRYPSGDITSYPSGDVTTGIVEPDPPLSAGLFR